MRNPANPFNDPEPFEVPSNYEEYEQRMAAATQVHAAASAELSRLLEATHNHIRQLAGRLHALADVSGDERIGEMAERLYDLAPE